jgi:hypothetical protein
MNRSSILDGCVIDRGFDDDDCQDMWLRSIAEHGCIQHDPVAWTAEDCLSTEYKHSRLRALLQDLMED